MFDNETIADFECLAINFQYVGGAVTLLNLMPDKRNDRNADLPDVPSARYIMKRILRDAYRAATDSKYVHTGWGNIMDLVCAMSN